MSWLMKLVILWAFWAGMAVAQGQTPEQGIIVTGEGRVSTPPDMVAISLGVTGTGKTTSDVMENVTGAAAAIQAKLAALGIDPEDRPTSGFYLHPVHNNTAPSNPGAPEITGYRAGNTITVRLRDLALSGPLMDEVIAIGVNNFNGLSFSLQDPASSLGQARAAAVADARVRAGQLAQAAGLTLGDVLRITENSYFGGPRMAMAEGRSSMGDAIVSGEVDVTAQVTMVFAIAPGGQ